MPESMPAGISRLRWRNTEVEEDPGRRSAALALRCTRPEAWRGFPVERLGRGPDLPRTRECLYCRRTPMAQATYRTLARAGLVLASTGMSAGLGGCVERELRV